MIRKPIEKKTVELITEAKHRGITEDTINQILRISGDERDFQEILDYEITDRLMNETDKEEEIKI